MIKVLFVCYGNICRSPMAEYICKHIVQKQGLEDKIYISSAATSDENTHRNADMYPPIKTILDKHKISYNLHQARQITKKDYEKYDYILYMEQKNYNDIISIVGNDSENKIHRLLDFSDNPKDIIDPWFYNNYEQTYDDITCGCNNFLKKVLKNQSRVL